MAVKFFEVQLKSSKQMEFFNITEQVRQKVKESKVKDGLCLVFSRHTTCCVKVNEWEKSLVEVDFPKFFEKLAPKNAGYSHDVTNVDDRPNAHSHLCSMLLSQSALIPVKDSALFLGNWQSIYFIDLDGPREKRAVVIEVIGE